MGVSRVLPPAEMTSFPTTRTDRILVILVEFEGEGEEKGPLHNEIPKPQPPKTSTLWVSDFAVEHYNDMLFSRDHGALSMANYYLEQSSGRYTVEGKVVGWYKLPHPESYYGADNVSSLARGTDSKNGPVWRVVSDAIRMIPESEIDWDYFDQEDRYDYDGDKNFREPDGYIDHVMLVHAGMGQEAGGGLQGSNALWSHRSIANYVHNGGPLRLGPQKYKQNGGLKVEGTHDLWALDYTLMPENGGPGVFSHEFGHDLGLPDLYDTQPVNGSESSTAFWDIMSQGSWSAGDDQVLGTMPTGFSAWSKMELGWLNFEEVHLDNLTSPKSIILDRASFNGRNKQALKINLPQKRKVVSIAEPTSGQYLFHGGLGNLLDNSLVKIFDLTKVSSATLQFNVFFEIETNYDYAYVEALNDEGQFVSIPGSITTPLNPNSMNLGHGITGQSQGWIHAQFDLTPFVGKRLAIRFRYKTDPDVYGKGFAIDDIRIPEIGYLENVENVTEISKWIMQGFSRLQYGEDVQYSDHYYFAEWRSYFGFDQALGNVYKGMPPGENLPDVEFYKYAPGLVLWYRNLEYREGDNRVGVHPGEGFLLVVDAHSEPLMLTPERPWSTAVQLFDAAFSKENISPFKLTGLNDILHTLSAKANSIFDDSRTYYSELDPDNSVKTPHMGLQIKVAETALDKSLVLLELSKKRR